MANSFSYNIFGTEDFWEISAPERVCAKLLDDRHLSKSALRAFELLEFIGTRKMPVRAIEVAQALDLTPSSADQLLKSLASRAYLIFDTQQKLYRPSPRLLAFSAFLGQAYFGGRQLHDLMENIIEKTSCSISICTPFGRLMQLVEYMAPPENSLERPQGELFQLFNSAAGAAILATWPTATVLTLIDQSRDQLGALADQPNVILSHLDEVRAHGHAFGGLSEVPDQCGIAIALPKMALGVELTLTLRGSINLLRSKRWHFAALLEEAVSSRLS